jgi:hypothetical protein
MVKELCEMKPVGFLRSFTLTFLTIVATLLFLMRASPASADNCLKAAYGKNVQCSANDVSISFADNPRNLDGSTLSQCTQGKSFSFIADFHVTTTATARENIGLYFQTAGGSTALTGTCSDNIIAPYPHRSANPADTVDLGSKQYQELDTTIAGDNCGDISTADNNQVVTVEIDDVSCQPGANGLLALPNCTSWQQPGGALKCVSPTPNYPWVPAAIPGSPSKCNCEAGFTVPIFVSPALTVTKNCSTAKGSGALPTPSCSLDDTGSPGTVTYTATVSNSGGGATINQICDSAYGTIATTANYAGPPCQAGIPGLDGTATATSCTLPATVANGGTPFSCTFTASQGENSKVTDTVTANGIGSDGSTPTSGTSNSVTVTAGEAATTGTITKSLNSITSNCATVRYGVDVKNTSSADETLTLSALNDSAYGDITKSGTANASVLGTTCGVTSGVGTLSGSPGVPFGTLAAGGDYQCQFDAQFCGVPGPITGTACSNGISKSDTVSATLTGDEGEVVSLTPGALTVIQCITTSAQ